MTDVNDIDTDAERLRLLGYKQELTRLFNRITNYGFALSVISMSGVTTLFAFGMTTGGPVVMIWGWIVVAIFTLFVGLSMAEICSAYPTSGGLYFWAGTLVAQEYKPIASWFTGWFNLLGQFTITSAIDFGLAMIVASIISLVNDLQWSPQPYHIVLIHLVLVISQGICNSIGPRFLLYITHISTWWQLIAPIIIALALFFGAKPGHQSASFIFTDFENYTGWSSTMYVILIGLLPAQFTFTGYDASAHMTEETKGAEFAAPWGIIMAIIVSAITGWILIIALFFGMHDYEATLNTSTKFPVAQILIDNFGRDLTIFFLFLLLVALWLAGLASITANSRTIYAFSRDHAMPGSRWWHKINPHVSCPLNAVWLSCLIAFLLSLTYLVNSTAYSALTGLTSISLYISYVSPVVCKLIYSKRFVPGPFNLGSFSVPINIVAILWVAFISVVFILPPVYPVTATNMNYALVGVGGIIILCGLAYALSARHWFYGPVTNIDSS